MFLVLLTYLSSELDSSLSIQRSIYNCHQGKKTYEELGFSKRHLHSIIEKASAAANPQLYPSKGSDSVTFKMGSRCPHSMEVITNSSFSLATAASFEVVIQSSDINSRIELIYTAAGSKLISMPLDEYDALCHRMKTLPSAEPLA